MAISVNLNNRGFTLIEVIIALLILMIGSLAVAQVAVMVIDTNMGNLLRDEAVRIADRRINGELRSTTAPGVPIPGLASLDAFQLAAQAGLGQQTITVAGDARGIQRNFTVVWLVTRPDTLNAPNVFLAQVWVGWDYKGGSTVGLAPTGRAFQHGVSRLITRGS